MNDIQYLLEKARVQAYKAVDNIRVQTYWQMGERIAREELNGNNRAVYNEQIIEKLSKDLSFNRVILYRILQFYKSYPIVSTLSRQLSWSHIVELLGVVNLKERQFYERITIENALSVRGLRRQINNNLYSKKENKIVSFENQKLSPQAPEEVFKDSYNFEFLKLPDNYNESKIEQSLLLNIEQLLLEFGENFSLAGRQKKIIIDQQIHTIDLEFFHRGIPCVVLIDLKVGKFRSEYVGQMNKYLNYYRENRKFSWEKDPVGLIICAEKGVEEVHYALGNLTNQIFVAEYKLKLPTEKEIKNKLKKARKK